MLTEELQAIKRQYEQLTQSTERQRLENASANEAALTLPGNEQQRKLVSKLNNYLLSNNNFTNPDIERDSLISELATNKTYLYDAIKIVTGKTLQEYINSFRLEEARRLLDSRSEYTILSIASACGFNSYRTFQRLFRKKYRLSPGEYSKLARTEGRV